MKILLRLVISRTKLGYKTGLKDYNSAYFTAYLLGLMERLRRHLRYLSKSFLKGKNHKNNNNHNLINRMKMRIIVVRALSALSKQCTHNNIVMQQRRNR